MQHISQLIGDVSMEFYTTMVDHLVDNGYWTSTNFRDFVASYMGA